jgi:hypothetical protein
MLTLILIALGIVVYGISIVVFWEGAQLAVACMALQYNISPEALECLQSNTRGLVPPDENLCESTGESDHYASKSGPTINTTSPPTQINAGSRC